MLLVLAALAGAGGAPSPPTSSSAAQELSAGDGVGGVLVALLVPVAHLAVGVTLLRGAVPKFGLAYAAVAGALARRPAADRDLPGQQLHRRGPASRCSPASGCSPAASRSVPAGSLGVVALALTVLAGVVAVVAWGRTVMDDGGALDPVRSALAGAVGAARRRRPCCA